MRGATAGVQWNEAETLTGADLVKKEIEDGVVVKVYSVTKLLDPEPSTALQKKHPEKTQGARIIQLRFHNRRLCYCGGCGFSFAFRCSS